MGYGVQPPPMVEPEEQATVPDFSRREFALREWMDEPCTFSNWEMTLQHLARMNRLLGGARPTLKFMERVVAARGVGHEPLHVVDVGCGDGEMLRAVGRWAAKRSVPVKLTGVDMNPYAARAARARDHEQGFAVGRVEWLTADAFEVPMGAPVDVVICSLFTHHLPDEGVVRFLRWMEATARCGWMVDDIERTERGYRMFGWLAKLMRWHPFIVHDGLASIRRAFVRADWVRMLGEAEVGGPEGAEGVEVVSRGEGRLCVERVKDRIS